MVPAFREAGEPPSASAVAFCGVGVGRHVGHMVPVARGRPTSPQVGRLGVVVRRPAPSGDAVRPGDATDTRRPSVPTRRAQVDAWPPYRRTRPVLAGRPVSCAALPVVPSLAFLAGVGTTDDVDDVGLGDPATGVDTRPVVAAGPGALDAVLLGPATAAVPFLVPTH